MAVESTKQKSTNQKTTKQMSTNQTSTNQNSIRANVVGKFKKGVATLKGDFKKAKSDIQNALRSRAVLKEKLKKAKTANERANILIQQRNLNKEQKLGKQ